MDSRMRIASRNLAGKTWVAGRVRYPLRVGRSLQELLHVSVLRRGLCSPQPFWLETTHLRHLGIAAVLIDRHRSPRVMAHTIAKLDEVKRDHGL